MWIGPSKPPLKHLLEPLMDEINHLTTVGMTIKLSNNSNVTVVLGIFDLPVKASVTCNLMGYVAAASATIQASTCTAEERIHHVQVL